MKNRNKYFTWIILGSFFWVLSGCNSPTGPLPDPATSPKNEAGQSIQINSAVSNDLNASASADGPKNILKDNSIVQSTQFSSSVITTATISGIKYYIMLDKISTGNSEIWARRYTNMSSTGDTKIVSLQTILKTTNDAMNMVCTINNYYSTITTVAGCGSVIGTGICIYTGAGVGVAAPLCVATVSYAASTGLVDCVSGIASAVSNYFNTADYGIVYQTQYGKFSASSAVSTALTLACDSWKKRSTNVSSPTALSASKITTSTFTANWNASNGATTYYLDLSTSSSFSSYVNGYSNKNVGNATSSNVTGLNANTTYYYRVRASNSSSTSSNSTVITTQTLPNAPLPPSAKSASNIATTSFTANWNSSSGATTYYLDVATTSSFSSYVSGYNNKNVGNTTFSNVTGLNANSTYYYRVRASNSSSTSSNSTVITAQTLPNTPLPPSIKSASNVATNSFTANWNASSGATTYYLDVSTSSSFASCVSGYNNKNVGNTTSSNVTGLKNNTIYYYRVRSANSAGSSNNSSIISVTTKK